MNQTQRAKQFAPFSAIRGLEEALREQELKIMLASEQDEETTEERNRRRMGLEVGTQVQLVNRTKTGCFTRPAHVTRINPEEMELHMDGAWDTVEEGDR